VLSSSNKISAVCSHTSVKTQNEKLVPAAYSSLTMDPLLDHTSVSFDPSLNMSRSLEGPDLDLSVPTVLTIPSSKPEKKKKRKHDKMRLCTFSLAEAEHQLLTFNCNVGGFAARVLIDGSAEGNVISTKFQKQHNLSFNLCNPIPVLLPDGSSTITSYTVPVTVQRDGYIDILNPILYPLKKYDLILGKPWLIRINPQIN
jgi:hypothetical protein